MNNKRILILIITLCIITAASLTVSVVLLIRGGETSDGNIEYPAVSDDPAMEPASGDASDTPLENPEGGGAVSLTYSNKATAPGGDGTAAFMIQNPAKSNQGVVIQIHIADDELIKKIGKTGRTEAEKAIIEGAEDYDSKTSRMIIAESGLIAPGYKLSEIKLKALPDGTVLPAGTYNAIYYILSYDRETHERAIVNVQMPITLTIEG